MQVFKAYSLVFIIVYGLACMQASAQTKTPKSGDFGAVNKNKDFFDLRNADSLKNQVDAIDILYKIYKLQETRVPDTNAKKIKRIYFSVLPGVSYAVQSAFGIATAANISFYTVNSDDENLSTITATPTYTLQNQFFVYLVSNIWSANNEYNSLGDYRFYRYPSVTFGLGGNTPASAATRIDYSYFRLYHVIAKRITPAFLAGIGYDLDYHWDITKGNAKNNEETDFQKYGFNTKSVSSGLSLNLIYDGRKNINYPLNGYYMNLSLRPNFTFLGSDNNWQALQLDLRKYVNFPENTQNVLAFWNLNWYTFGNAPYLDLPATGWDTYSNMGRGYAQDRFKGTKLEYLETEYRFGLTKNGLFGMVVFANAQTVANWPSGNFSTVEPAIGTGLRIKINKGAHTNLCLDYGEGLHGSKGFFFNLGEVF